MTSMPDPPDLDQIRIQAKALKLALLVGEQTALDRVLASHPKFAGRPAARLEGWTSTLRDAQATIARELGFGSWKALITELATTIVPAGIQPRSSNTSRRRSLKAPSRIHLGPPSDTRPAQPTGADGGARAARRLRNLLRRRA